MNKDETVRPLTPYRMWVLRHWKMGGWSTTVDRLCNKKAEHNIRHLIKNGLLELAEGSDVEFISNGLFRITDAGQTALREASNVKG